MDNSQSSEKADRSYSNFELATVTEEISTDKAMKLMMREDIEENIEEQIAPNIECKECMQKDENANGKTTEVFTGHTSNRRNYGKG